MTNLKIVEPVTIVTHLNPDFDALLSVWILRKFGGLDYANLEFVPVGKQLSSKNGEKLIHVDTGLSEFDNHKSGNEDKSSAELVFEHLKIKSDLALKKLVDFSHRVDFGLLDNNEYSPYNVVAILSGLNQLHPDEPQRVASIGFSILNSIYIKLQDEVLVFEELKKAIEFKTIWGNGLAIETDNMATRSYAYRQGFKVFLSKSPSKGYVGFKAQGGSGVDFTTLYLKLTTL